MLTALLIPFLAIFFFGVINLLSDNYKVYKKPTPPKNLLKTFSVRFASRIDKIIYLWTATFLGIYCLLALVSNSFATVLVRGIGLFGILLIFLVLLPGIVHVYFPLWTVNGILLKSRRSIGLSAAFVSLLHTLLAFEVNFHGSVFTFFSLSQNYQFAALAALSALVIFILMAIVDLRKIEHKLGYKDWKLIHRFIYLAALLVIFHIFVRGYDFQNKRRFIPLLFNFLTLSFILFETGATVRLIKIKQELKNIAARYGIYLILFLVVVLSLYTSFSQVNFG